MGNLFAAKGEMFCIDLLSFAHFAIVTTVAKLPNAFEKGKGPLLAKPMCPTSIFPHENESCEFCVVWIHTSPHKAMVLFHFNC